MRFRHTLASLVGATALIAASHSCSTRSNYLHPEGPRFAADYAQREAAEPRVGGRRVPQDMAPSFLVRPAETLKVVSYNVRYGEELDEAIDVLVGTPELADADVILLQEMHAPGVDRIARALGYSYVHYPASLRTSGRDFGNAVLTRGRIVDDRKVLLPHVNPVNRQRRTATLTELELGENGLLAYSVHTETSFLSLSDREEQIVALLDSVPRGSQPCLIAGDFNTMSDRSLGRFDDMFSREGFERASLGIGSTFDLGPFGYAMDHVFVRGLRVVAAGKVEDADASDHLPVWVELAWGDTLANETPALADSSSEATHLRASPAHAATSE